MDGLSNFLLSVVIFGGALWIAWRMNRPTKKPKHMTKPVVRSKPASAVPTSSTISSGADVSYLYPHGATSQLFGADTPGHHSKHDKFSSRRGDEEKPSLGDTDTTSSTDTAGDHD